MINEDLKLAWEFVNFTNRNIFLTGKAGTGKTTFLHKLRDYSQKRIVVVAPTGVAAINAKGVTIHSFFQLQFGPILPNREFNLTPNFNRKFSKTKINIIKSLDLLVIDEISMVRADLLDGIDKTLRRFKNKNLVFGGTQLLLIGDLQQLSPIVNINEWQLLKQFYKNAYFFSSRAFLKCNAIIIELKHIFRQNNPLFIKILNEVRNNNLSKASINSLNKRYNPDFIPSENEGYISLTTHNYKANQINNQELNKLVGLTQNYKALIEGNYPEHLFPNKKELIFKIGAQVMFIKNDNSEEKQYYNGKIGKIIHLDEDEVIVKCPDDKFNIITRPVVWENMKYSIDPKTKAISEDKIGSFTQMPLRLAWSITIHKSQGLTFEKAIIDAEAAFAHGQTYVALSRCKSLDGLILKSKITTNSIINDANVMSFNQESEAKNPNENVLHESKRLFQYQLISEVFDFYKFLYPLNRILDIYYNNKGSIVGNMEQPLLTLKEVITTLLKVSSTFNSQLKSLVVEQELPESSTLLQDRFVKAINYFNAQTESMISTSINDITFTTDNKTIEKDIVKNTDALKELLAIKLLFFSGLQSGFRTQEFLNLRGKSVFLAKDKPKKPRKTIIDSTTNVELFELLRELRNSIAHREDLIHYQIFTQKSLYAMCELLPVTLNELKGIHGMGKTRVKKYGKEILDVIITYCNENEVETSNQVTVFKESKSTRAKIDTKKISLDLFKSGKSIDQIAFERDLNSNTIFGHLASYIPSGEVNITDLISKENYSDLKEIIPTITFENLSDLKHQIDDKYSYAEIRLILDELSK